MSEGYGIFYRIRTCSMKVRYGVKSEARAAAHRVPKKHGRRAKAYPCPFSTFLDTHYHVGHSFRHRISA